MFGAKTIAVCCAAAAIASLPAASNPVGVEARTDGHARAAAEEGRAVGAEIHAARAVERDGDLQVGCAERRLDQHAPHAAGRSGDRESNGHRRSCVRC